MNDFQNKWILAGSLGAVFMFTLIFSYGPGYGGSLLAFLSSNVTSSPKMSPSDTVTPMVTPKKLVTLKSVTNVTSMSPSVFNEYKASIYYQSPTISPRLSVSPSVSPRITTMSPTPRVSPTVSPVTPTPVVTPAPSPETSAETTSPTVTPEPETPTPTPTPTPIIINSGDVVINEIGWMGTAAPGTTGSSDEWIELYNPNSQSVDLTGWHLASTDSSPNISLTGTISARGYYLIERSPDDLATSIIADLAVSFGTGGLKNDPGEKLVLTDASESVKDMVDCSAGPWFSGDNDTKSSMERINPYTDGNDPSNWATNDGVTRNGQNVAGGQINGTPRMANSVSSI